MVSHCCFTYLLSFFLKDVETSFLIFSFFSFFPLSLFVMIWLIFYSGLVCNSFPPVDLNDLLTFLCHTMEMAVYRLFFVIVIIRRYHLLLFHFSTVHAYIHAIFYLGTSLLPFRHLSLSCLSPLLVSSFHFLPQTCFSTSCSCTTFPIIQPFFAAPHLLPPPPRASELGRGRG